MASKFLTRSRHGTIYYFRRRVPLDAQDVLGRRVLVQSLQTSDRRLAVIRSRLVAARTDVIFCRIAMDKRSGKSDFIQTDYTFKIDFDEFGRLTSISGEAEPHEQDALNSSIRTALETHRGAGIISTGVQPSGTCKPFNEAIAEYFTKSQAKPQTKKTYRSKLNHAQEFFEPAKDIFTIGQAEFVRYCDHVVATVENPTTQGLYMSTVMTFLNWHRQRAGLTPLSTRTLIPKRDTPESDDREAYSLDQLRAVFENAAQYRRRYPHKFWASVAPAFLGCRIEELCQIYLPTDLVQDDEAGIWYLVFDERPDPDGVVRKSVKKMASWRRVPIHSCLVRHGFVDFLRTQQRYGSSRPFEKYWIPLEVDDPELGRITKWSHYISRWGGTELKKLAQSKQFDIGRLSYFHSMRHTFKVVLGDAGVSSEVSEALAGRRYGGAEAERYEKLRRNHRRLSAEGIERGLGVLAKLLDDVLAD